MNRVHFSSGQKLLSDVFNRIVDYLLNKSELAFYSLRSPYESGLLYDLDLPFNIKEEGEKISLKSIAAITSSGHMVQYKSNSRDYGPELAINTHAIADGGYFIYLYYLGTSIPWVSSSLFGKTTREDIRVPKYNLDLRSEIQSMEKFPNSILLGRVDIRDGKAIIDRTFFPLIYQLGSCAKGVEILDRTKKLWDELRDVSFKIYRDLKDVPRDSVFADTRDLAQELKTFIIQNDVNIRHFNKKTSLFELFKVWSKVANIFRTYLYNDRLGVRPGDAIQTLYAAAIRRGEYQIENHLLTVIQACAKHIFDINNPNSTIQLIDNLIDYAGYTWVANHPIKLPNEKSISIQPNRY